MKITIKGETRGRDRRRRRRDEWRGEIGRDGEKEEEKRKRR